MTTKEKIAVMQAFEDGKQVELCNGCGGGWRDVSGEPIWNWDEYDYRIKPQPKLRPWRPEEVPVGCLIRRISDPSEIFIIDGRQNYLFSISIHEGGARWDTENLLNVFHHSTDNGANWKPCGVEESI